ncbi:MAG TPA: aldo/keto reductase [Myxococcota bacterium]|nr:aldo/keto reductase [Myxococcota bacterium]
MIRILEGSDERHVGVLVDGRIGADDAHALFSLLEESIEKHGRVSVLVQLESLGLVDPRALVEDLRFSISHARQIERGALVGRPRWLRAWARAVDAVMPFATRAFGADELDAAWRWLRREPDASAPAAGSRQRSEPEVQSEPKVLSANGARIPALGLGTWQLEGETCTQRVADALAMGYRHVDTAKAYGNHAAVGAGLTRAGVDRDEIFLTSKVWFDDLAYPDVIASTEASLKELGTDHLDLLLVHWPNPRVPLEETFEAMLELREKQRIRYLGVSNFPPTWVERAVRLAPIVCDQVEYHPLLGQDHLLEKLRAHDMALVAYSPLAHGEGLDHPTLQEIARAHGRSPAEVALRWLLAQDGVGAIPKAASRAHLEQNLRATTLELSGEEMRRIHALAEREGERTVDPDFAPSWER